MSFEQIFNQKSEIKECAHARVNIIGEHTDYTGGFVMPTLLSFNNSVEIAINNQLDYQVYSDNFKEKKIFNDFIKSKNNEWIDYIKGCLFIFFNEIFYFSSFLLFFVCIHCKDHDIQSFEFF